MALVGRHVIKIAVLIGVQGHRHHEKLAMCCVAGGSLDGILLCGEVGPWSLDDVLKGVGEGVVLLIGCGRSLRLGQA